MREVAWRAGVKILTATSRGEGDPFNWGVAERSVAQRGEVEAWHGAGGRGDRYSLT